MYPKEFKARTKHGFLWSCCFVFREVVVLFSGKLFNVDERKREGELKEGKRDRQDEMGRL